jgi:hypothetical protein
MERSTKHEAKLILTWLISVHGCDQAYIAFMCRSWFLLRFLRRSGTLGPPRVRGFLPKYGILESPYVVALTYDNYTHRVAPRNSLVTTAGITSFTSAAEHSSAERPTQPRTRVLEIGRRAVRPPRG